ncbi:MAG: hypothetical protein U0457_18600 [Candidatus Sericytochromatia bacterium]
MASSINNILEEEFFEKNLDNLYSIKLTENRRDEIKVLPSIEINTNNKSKKRNFIEKHNLTKINIFLLATVFTLICIEGAIYYGKLKYDKLATSFQSEFRKATQVNDNLTIELEKVKELSNIEFSATKLYGMRTSENSEIKYLPMPHQNKETNDLIYKTLKETKKVDVPVGF